MKPAVRGIIAGVVGVAMCGSALTPPALADTPMASQAMAPLSRSNDIVRDIVFDTLPFGQPGKPVRFSPDVAHYDATAFYHKNFVSVRVLAEPGAAVTVNGQPVDADGRVSGIRINPGTTTVTVTATKGALKKTYTIDVHKVYTDFRGYVSLPATAVVNGAPANVNPTMTDGKDSTSYLATPLKTSAAWSNDATGLTVSLKKPAMVKRINLYADGIFRTDRPVKWWSGGTNLSIAVRADASSPWKIVTTTASLRRETFGLHYYDFTIPMKVQDIRIWANGSVGGEVISPDITGIRFKDVEVWGEPANYVAPQPETPIDNSRYDNFDPGQGKWGLNRAQTLAMQYGVKLSAWVPGQNTARGTFDNRERQLTGGDVIPVFADAKNLENTDLMKVLGDGTPWGVANAPAGKVLKTSLPTTPGPFIPPSMSPYTGSLVDIQFGDEEPANKAADLGTIRKWFDYARNRYPGAVLHMNQAVGLWHKPQLEDMITTVKPDLLSFDRYPYSTRTAAPFRKALQNGTRKISRASFIMNPTWYDQRELALKGLTGDGSSPIQYGQYLDYSFEANVSESQKAIVPALGLASGEKWFGLFRLEYNGPDFGSIIDPDGAPTREFYEFQKIFKDIRGLGHYLKAMNNTYLAMKPGQYDDAWGTALPEGYKMSSDFTKPETKDALKAVGIEDASAVNEGTVNNGKPGDVVIGTFDTLPGLAKDKINEIFGATAQAPKGFMVVNSLVGPTLHIPQQKLFKRTDNGAYWQTAQTITVNLDKPVAGEKLMMVDPMTYKAEPVPMSDTPDATHASMTAKDGSYSLTIPYLGGGQSRLFYWVKTAASNPQPTPAPNPGTSIGSNSSSAADKDSGSSPLSIVPLVVAVGLIGSIFAYVSTHPVPSMPWLANLRKLLKF